VPRWADNNLLHLKWEDPLSPNLTERSRFFRYLHALNYAAFLPYPPVAFTGCLPINLPAKMSTELQAETRNGKISNEFSMMTRHAGARGIHGRIGRGGRQCRLKTVKRQHTGAPR